MASRQDRSEYSSGGEWGRVLRQRQPLRCVVCGQYGRPDWLQADHIIPRAQGGLNDLWNGLLVCGDRGCRAHARKTAGVLRYRREWLLPEHVAYLAAAGWVVWGEDGQPSGRGWRHFEPTGQL